MIQIKSKITSKNIEQQVFTNIPKQSTTIMNVFIEFLTDGFINHPGYPASIQIPHAIAAAWYFRKSYSAKDYFKLSFWHKLIAPYFCHGYGGTTARDLLLSRPISIVAHETILSYYLPFGLFLVNYSPNDIVYRMLETKLHPFRLLTIAGDACDSTTTILSTYELALRLHPKSPFAPFAAGAAAMVGGSCFRWLERRERMPQQQTEWSNPSGGIQSGMIYMMLYHYLRSKYGIRFARFWTVMLNIIIKLVADIGLKKWSPAIWLYDRMYHTISQVKTTFRLGPQQSIEKIA